ncbi:MAG: hypothetical protein ACE5MK_04245 [Acidobacteriota bacterium]
MIDVKQTREGDLLEFSVTVREESSETHHRVSMAQSTYQKLTGGNVSPERCIQAAFKFLLEREPKESILSSFDVTVISRYFPSFEREFSRYI